MRIGTLRCWTWEDDHGQQHSFDIPNSYYVPDGKLRLLTGQRTRCGETTNGNECVLFWNDGNHKLHIELGRDNNVATFPLAHGYPKFEAFCCEAALNDPSSDPIAMPSSIISDDEDDHEEVTTGTPQSLKPSWQRNVTSSDTGTPQTTGTTTFDLNGPSIPAPGGESAQTPRSKNLRTS